LTIGQAARAQLEELISNAAPLEGNFFRSVAFQYFHPDDVISGERPRAYGGRFVLIGVPAVYASVEEDTAFREAANRQSLLRGQDKMDFRAYPRLTYVLRIKTERSLNLSTVLAPELRRLIINCLVPDQHLASQQLAHIWIAEGIESIVFRSATGVGHNIAVYVANSQPESVSVVNRDEIIAHLRGRLL
jgi:RES domain-containing protein